MSSIIFRCFVINYSFEAMVLSSLLKVAFGGITSPFLDWAEAEDSVSLTESLDWLGVSKPYLPTMPYSRAGIGGNRQASSTVKFGT